MPGAVVYSADASSCSSVADGNFSNAATWSCVGGTVRGKSTDVTITHVVDLDLDYRSGPGGEVAVSGDWTISGTLQNGGDLSFSSGTQSITGVLDIDDMVISNGLQLILVQRRP